MDLHPRHLIIAVLLHAALFSLLFVSAFFQRKIEQVPVITAILVPSPLPKPPEPKPEPPTPEPKKEPTPPEPEPTPEEKLADVLKKLDCDTIPDMKKEASLRLGAEKQLLLTRIADMEARCAKKEAAKKKKEEERQKKLEEERLKREEKQRKEEIERMLDQERHERELAEQQRRQSELEAAAIAEANARADAAANKALAEWGALVKQKVKRNWSRPPTLSRDLAAQVRISQLPSGQITDVKIIKSSGNAVYDDSVEKAIRKSDPLPRLSDPFAFAKARELVFNFTAKDLSE